MFDETRLYTPRDPELRVIASYSLLAQWRHEGRGPAYIKSGARVLYSGKALNEWLEAQTVQPAAA